MTRPAHINGAAAGSRATSHGRRRGGRTCFVRLLSVADHRQQALGVSAVRSHGAARTRSSCREWAPASCASKGTDRALAMSVDGNGRFVLPRPVSRGACSRSPKRRATSPAPGASRLAPPTASISAIPSGPRSCGSSPRAVEGIGDGVPRTRHSHHRRKRQPLQRNRRSRRYIRRRCSASSG